MRLMKLMRYLNDDEDEDGIMDMMGLALGGKNCERL